MKALLADGIPLRKETNHIENLKSMCYDRYTIINYRVVFAGNDAATCRQ